MSADGAAAGRVLVLAWLGQLAASSGLLLWASTGPRIVPLWCGMLDVALALAFIVTSGCCALGGIGTRPRTDSAGSTALD